MVKVDEDIEMGNVSYFREVKINIEKEETGPIIYNMMLRFPHLARDIFKELDNKSLENCRKLNRQCCDFIHNQKFPWIRSIRRYKGTMKKFQKQWYQVLQNIPTETVKQLSFVVQEFSKKYFMDNQYSPLHMVSGQGNVELFKFIMEKIGEPNPATIIGNTPFHFAAENGHMEICSIIIENIENKNPASKNGLTPLHIAAQNGYLDICKLILENVENKNPYASNGTPLHLAAAEGHLKICKLLLKSGVEKSPIFNGKTPFQMAESNGQFKICLFLMNSRKDFDRLLRLSVQFPIGRFCSFCFLFLLIFIFNPLSIFFIFYILPFIFIIYSNVPP